MLTPSVQSIASPPHGRLSWAGLLLACLLAALSAGAADIEAPIQSRMHAFRVVTLADGLEHPWSLAFLPDGRILVSERPGRLRLFENGRLHPEPIAGLPPIRAHGQGGLFDIVLHPEHRKNGWIYFSLAGPGPGLASGTELARGRLHGHRLEDVEVLFRMTPKRSGGQHFGGRIVFDRAGFVYLTLGDRGEMDEAQNLANHIGAVVRLHDDGRVPRDNPYLGRANARPEVFSHGHRNIQGAARHPVSGAIWSHEHGPQGGDEINILRPGVNYGWPVITYGAHYGSGEPIGEGTHKPGMAQPLYRWTPSIAPSGMAFYDADAFPRWRGDLFLGGLRSRMLVRLRLDGDKVVEEERLLTGRDRIRDVRTGPDGRIYLLTDAANGRLMRLEPAGN